MPFPDVSKTVHLTDEGIDDVLKTLVSGLDETKCEPGTSDEVRTGISFVLHRWQTELGEDTVCTLQSGKRTGRTHISITAPGKKVSIIPEDGEDVLPESEKTLAPLLSHTGIAVSFQYENSENRITLLPRRKKLNPIIPLLAAIAAGIITGLILTSLPAEVSSGIAKSVFTPLSDTFLGVLKTISLPLIFLSLTWGIYSIGDLATLSSIGKSLVGRYIGRVFFTLIISLIILLPVLPVVFSFNGEMGDPFSPVFLTILGMAPSNIAAPFLNGNTLQVIFIAILFGLSLLVLSKKVPECVKVIGQLNSVIQKVMGWIIYLIPIFIFANVVNVMLTVPMSDLISCWQLLAGFAVCILVVIIIMILSVSLRLKIHPKIFIKKALPVYLLTLSTASSAAAFPRLLKTSRDDLGINNKLTYFGVPLGIAFSRGGYALSLFATALFLAIIFNVEMTVSWVVIALILSGLLAIAAPPVPGGALIVLSLLMTQLGIPMEAMAIGVVASILLDFPSTSHDMLAILADLTHVAKKSKQIDYNILRNTNPEKAEK